MYIKAVYKNSLTGFDAVFDIVYPGLEAPAYTVYYFDFIMPVGRHTK
jgi:hypothetical protein